MTPTFDPILGELRNRDLALSEIDRLTSQIGALSTLILTDDSTDQTLTGSLGKLNITSQSDFKLNTPTITYTLSNSASFPTLSVPSGTFFIWNQSSAITFLASAASMSWSTSNVLSLSTATAQINIATTRMILDDDQLTFGGHSANSRQIITPDQGLHVSQGTSGSFYPILAVNYNNAAGTRTLLELQNNATSKFQVAQNGAINISGGTTSFSITAAAGTAVYDWKYGGGVTTRHSITGQTGGATTFLWDTGGALVTATKRYVWKENGVESVSFDGRNLNLTNKAYNSTVLWGDASTIYNAFTVSINPNNGYISRSDISFQDNGASNDTITTAAGDFVASGFVAGQIITVSGATNPGNNNSFTIESLTTTIITLISTDTLTTEVAGAAVTIYENGSADNASTQFRVLKNGNVVYAIDRDGRTLVTGQNGNSFAVGVTPYAGNYPLFILQNNGNSGASFDNTNGTWLAINAANGTLSNLADFEYNSLRKFLVDYLGNTGIAGNFYPLTNGGGSLGINGAGWASLICKDTAAAYELTIQATGSGMAGDQTLTIDTGNYSPTLIFSPAAGNPTIGDWFDQNVKTTGTPQFARVGCGAAADGTRKLSVNDSTSAPSTTPTPVFTAYYGGNTNALGDPNAWLYIDVGGTDYKIPLYT